MSGWLQSTWNDLQANWSGHLWTLISICLVWLAAHVAVRVVRRLIAASYGRRAKKHPPEIQRRLETASSIMQSVSRYVIWFIAIMGMVGELGFTSTVNSMLTAAGIGGIALGIGAQSFIKDVVAGIFFVFEDQMAVGDYITAADISGTVQEITLRTTVIRGYRGEVHVVPNGSIGVLTNLSRAEALAVVDISVAPGTDLPRAMACMREEGEAFGRESEDAVEPPVIAGVNALEPNAVTLRLTQRVRPMARWSAERALKQRIRERFDREGFETPYQRLDLLEKKEP